MSFATLKQYHEQLQTWTDHYYFLSIFLYMLIYIVAVALSVPGAVFITIAGGFLFGLIAILFVVLSATIGATIVFLAVRTTFGEWLASKAKGWVAKMEAGFKKNELNYLLVLRLIPIFPFWAINIVAGILGVTTRTFILATFIGIIPGSLVYVMMGNSLNTLFKSDQTPNINIIFTPAILLPLIALAILVVLPLIYRKWKGRLNGKNTKG